MSRKSIVLTIILVILLLVSLVGNVLLFLNSRSLNEQLSKQKDDITTLQQQVSDLSTSNNNSNTPEPTPIADNSAEYNYVYDIIKNVYPWDGLPAKSTLQIFNLGAGVGPTVDSYTLKTKQLDSSIVLGGSVQIPSSAIGQALVTNGWVVNDQSIADGPTGSSVEFKKDGKTLNVAFHRPFRDDTENTVTINFQANK